ncbi:peptidase C13 [Rhodanobacter sp. DHG33]|uniref:peptidase C13 n=1 Tax=Rhodanobacter sp. DHG33 TaxID=2775921 RepID=UPI001785A7B2|nr:peptidase C13 [Rhodanobacter sp. DHG33]MBD8898603.1 peptidase C13 [Rhodanobacter sp. DHG33]
MSIILAFAALLGAAPASANDDFQARVHAAKMAEAAATGPDYQKALWGKIEALTASAYKGCVAGNKPDDKLPFTLVLDVDAHGKPQNIAVQPDIPVAHCMAGYYASWTLPTPPAAPAPYPLEIDFSIKP